MLIEPSPHTNWPATVSYAGLSFSFNALLGLYSCGDLIWSI